jgi:hypothetical protein
MVGHTIIISEIDDKHECIKSNSKHLKVKHNSNCCKLCNGWEHIHLHHFHQQI